jgi:hypothetical protein
VLAVHFLSLPEQPFLPDLFPQVSVMRSFDKIIGPKRAYIYSHRRAAHERRSDPDRLCVAPSSP